ncbi:MAG: DUF4153 domain-containing protein, partial [Lachnospiraceae bacterium]|nr:DUF4153 domain-containing protein [Lachnospiraceae bacterium]
MKENSKENNNKENSKENNKDNNKVMKLFGKIKNQISGSFRDYPFTMVAIVIAAFFGAILADLDQSSARDLYERAMTFGLIFAVGELYCEECLKKEKTKYIFGTAISVILGLFFTYVFTGESNYIFGVKAETFSEICLRIITVYAITLIGMSVYHMFKRIETNFETYVTRAFMKFVKVTVIYGLFAIGLAVILMIFNELIYDTEELLLRIEVFLAGGIYAPMCLKTIAAKNTDAGKFAKICFNFALLPMLLIAFSIIYMYFIKIFTTDTVPSNVAFHILTFLFAVGAPVWTISRNINENTANSKLTALLQYIPYIFLPFVALQCYALGIRINQYGFTVSRYEGVIVIVAEVVYFVLYFMHQKGNKKAIAYILPIASVIAVFALLVPFTSYDDVVIRSQIKRIHNYVAIENRSDSQNKELKSAFNIVGSVGYKGEKVLTKEFSKTLLDEIKTYEDEYGYYPAENYAYIDLNNLFNDVDISDYARITKVTSDKLDSHFMA